MSGIVSLPIVKEQLRRYWPITLVFALLYLFIAGFGLHGAASSEALVVRSFVDIITLRNQLVWLSVFAMPLVTVACVMGFYNQPRAITVFSAMPVTRTQLAVSNAVAGVILLLLPVVLLFAILLVPIYRPIADPIQSRYLFTMGQNNLPFPYQLFGADPLRGTVVNTFAVVGGFILRLIIAKMFYFGLFWLMFAVVGNRLIGLMMVASVFVLPMLIYTTMIQFMEFYLFGFSATWHNVSPVTYLTPATGRLLSQGWRHYENILVHYSLYAVFAAVFLIGAVLISRVRKAEHVGNSIMFTSVKKILIFAVSTFSAVLVGMMLFSGTHGSVWFYLGACGGFVLGYVIAEMIAEKSLHIWRKLKYVGHFAIVAVGLFISAWLYTQFGAGWFVNFVPNPDDVSGVFISHRISGDTYGVRFIEDRDVILKTTQAHQSIIDYHRQNPQRAIAPVSQMMAMVTARPAGVPIIYRMNDGRYIRRHYMVGGEFFNASTLNDLFRHEVVLFQDYDFIHHPEWVRSIEITHSLARYNLPFNVDVGMGHREAIVIQDPGRRAEVIEAARLDILARAAQRERERLEPMPIIWRDTWDEPATVGLVFEMSINPGERLGTNFLWLRGEEQFESVMGLLVEWGYVE